MRNYTYNRFMKDNSLDLEGLSYFLGFLASDGCISYNSNGFRISMMSTDLDIIEKLKDRINYTGKIGVVNREKIGHKNKYYIHLIKSISEDLQDWLGLQPSKDCFSLDNIELKLGRSLDIYAFLRGFFDGDGCLYTHQRGRNKDKGGQTLDCIYFLAREKLKNELIKRFPQFKVYKIKLIPPRTKQIFKLFLSVDESYKILDQMYKNSTIHLERKYKKYKTLDRNSSRLKQIKKSNNKWICYNKNRTKTKPWQVRIHGINYGSFSTESEALEKRDYILSLIFKTAV